VEWVWAGERGGASTFFAHFLEALFVGDAEALLFVDDEKTEVGKISRLSKGRRCVADDHVHLARFQIPENFFFCSAALRKRLSISIRAGKAANLFLNVSKCWKVSTVVGARIATCLFVHYGF